VNAKRFTYCAVLLASALWLGTATLLSVAPGGPVLAESEPVVVGIKGAVVEEPVASAEAEARAETTGTEVLGAVEVAQSKLEHTKRQLSEVVEAAPPAPEPVSPPPALLQVSVSGGPAQASVNLDSSGVGQADVNANLGWLAFP
jgi:hypothetical protein